MDWICKSLRERTNISYTCSLCEINTKDLYKQLKKEANKEKEPKIFTIKTKKTNPKKEEENKNKAKKWWDF